jgi:hypothetical protein
MPGGSRTPKRSPRGRRSIESASRSDGKSSAAATAGRLGQRPSNNDSTRLCGSLRSPARFSRQQAGCQGSKERHRAARGAGEAPAADELGDSTDRSGQRAAVGDDDAHRSRPRCPALPTHRRAQRSLSSPTEPIRRPQSAAVRHRPPCDCRCIALRAVPFTGSAMGRATGRGPR